MKRSESINEITSAMAKAQAEIRNAAMDKTNPAFRSKYADLASVWAACRTSLSKYGIAVFQSPGADGPKVTVTTLLSHSSGQWVEGELTVTADKGTPQGIGSAITYARRYGLSALVGVAPGDDIADAGDDDGNEASGEQPNPAPSRVDGLKAKVAAQNGKAHIPQQPHARKENVLERLRALNFQEDKMAEQVVEWVGHPVNKATVWTADDWTRCDGHLSMLESEGTTRETLHVAQQVAEAAHILGN